MLYNTMYADTGMNFKEPVEQAEEMKPKNAQSRTQFIYFFVCILNTETPRYLPIQYIKRAEKLCLTN